MIKGVAFDFDGTLVRSNKIKRRGFYQAAAHLPGAKKILDDLFRAGFKGDRNELFAELIQRLNSSQPGLIAGQVKTLTNTYSKLCHENIRTCREVLGAHWALKKLYEFGRKLFLISATPEIDLLPIVTDRDMDHYFEFISGGPTKKTTHLANILERYSFEPNEFAMVGDGIDDSRAAADIGCRFIAVCNTGNTTPANSSHNINNLIPLPAILSEFDSNEE